MEREEKKVKLDISYPCLWNYKIIGAIETDVRGAIAAVVSGKEHRISLSKMSATGKYISLDLEMIVRDEEERTGIYKGLSAQPGVKMVL